jgi:hypothetical protein
VTVPVTSIPPSRRHAGTLLICAALGGASAFCASGAKTPSSKTDVDTLNGAWIVEATPPADAKFVTVSLKYKGIEWRLWMRKPGEMVGEGLASMPGKNNVASVPTTWRRQPGP